MINEMEQVAYSTNKIDKPMWEQDENGSTQVGSNVEIPEDLVRKLKILFLGRVQLRFNFSQVK